MAAMLRWGLAFMTSEEIIAEREPTAILLLQRRHDGFVALRVLLKYRFTE